MLKIPVIGKVLNESAIARFARTLAVTFKAGVPLVEALDSVAGATGSMVYEQAVMKMKDDVAVGYPCLLYTSVMLMGAFISMLLFAASAWFALKTLLPTQQRYWAWLGALCLPSIYGVVHIFSYNEPFLTSRPLAESFCLLGIGWLIREKWLLAAASLLLAGLFHPLQAIAGAAIIWVWAVGQDRRWLHALWLIFPVSALAYICLLYTSRCV